MFVGYATDHAGDVYCMWDPNTDCVHESRDVTWLKRMFFKKKLTKLEIMKNLVQICVESTECPEFGENCKNENPQNVQVGEGIITADDADDDNNVELIDKDDIELADELGDEQEDEEEIEKYQTTRSSRTVRPPATVYDTTKLGGEATTENIMTEDEIGALMAENYEIGLTSAETNYYAKMKEIGAMAYDGDIDDVTKLALFGAGIGGGFLNMQELHVMKYGEAMKTKDKPKWDEAVEDEYIRMQKNHKVFHAVPRNKVPQNAKILTSTLAMKKKAAA